MEYFTSRDGTTIGCKKAGSGPPLLLVHGTTADHRRWDAVTPELERVHTVYAMDRRGRGSSTDAPNYDLIREAEDVAAVVDGIGGSVRVVGHSYGALCSLEATVLTDNVERMVLYEPPIPGDLPMYPPSVPDRMRHLIDAGEREAVLEVFFREVVNMPDHEFVQYRELPMWKSRIELAPTIPRELAIDRLYTFDTDKFTDIRIPTLLLLGGDSPAPFQRGVQAIHAALAESTVSILPGQQHIAMDTDPDLFLEVVTGFLAG